MNKAQLLSAGVFVFLALCIAADRLYVARFAETFKKIERERIDLSNKLATAKIVSENLNHVRDLILTNMSFAEAKEEYRYETTLFEFLTACINDLKMELVKVSPVAPQTSGNITTIGYDIQLKGDFFTFGELCAKFENSRRIIDIVSFEVKQSDPAPVEKAAARQAAKARKFENIHIAMRVNTYRIRKG